MSRRPKGRPPAQLDKHRGQLEGVLVARLFGRESGPIFDPDSVPTELLEKFMSSESVRRMTCDFAIEIARMWQARYPGQSHLQPAGRTAPTAAHAQLAALNAAITSDSPLPLDAALGVASPAVKHGPSPVDPPSLKEGPVPHRKLHYNVPNAKSGEAYKAVVLAKNDQGVDVPLHHLELPPNVGLSFDPASGELHGIPKLAGEHAVNAFWTDAAGHKFTDTFLLIVNANPRDLWKNIEADASDPYFKPSEDSCHLSASGRRIAAASKRGRSHAHVGSFRDDDFFVGNDPKSGWNVLVVADGAGSAKSSRKGAALASLRSGSHLMTELGGEEGQLLELSIQAFGLDPTSASRPLKDKLYQLFGKAAWAALKAIEEEAATHSASVKDYATTLLCAIHCTTPRGSFIGSFWLGDGAICAYGPEGRIRLMGKPDSGEFAGQTRFLDRASLSDSQALWERIDFSEHSELTSLMLMTDGISDPRFETDNGLINPGKWQSLWEELTPLLAAEDPGKALVDWMDFFVPGHHDDRTMAVLW